MNKKIYKIIQTPPRFYPFIGGVEYYVYYLAREIVKKSFNVKVICAAEPNVTSSIPGVTVQRLWYPFKIANTNITPALPFVLLASHYDLVHTHMTTPWSSDWSILIAKLKNIPSVLTIHVDLDKPHGLSKFIIDLYINAFSKYLNPLNS